MPDMNDEKDSKELRGLFADVLDYESDDPEAAIDPLTYRTPEGDSCLHIAAIRGDNRAVELLLNEGLDINDIGDMGNTALHYALAGGHPETYDLLVSRGASQSIENEFGKVAYRDCLPVNR